MLLLRSKYAASSLRVRANSANTSLKNNVSWFIPRFNPGGTKHQRHRLDRNLERSKEKHQPEPLNVSHRRACQL
ncbi:hypothetical protein PO909_021716 [Leuciscus waleckii]